MKNLKTPDEYEAEIRALACGDNSCRVIEPRGMATNGGCRCGNHRAMMAPLEASEAFKLWRIIHLRREQVDALQTEVTEWKANHKRAVDNWTQDAQDLKAVEERIHKVEASARRLQVLLKNHRYDPVDSDYLFDISAYNDMQKLVAEILDPKLPE